MPSDPESIVIETGPDPVASIIWLHGLGADGHDFESIVPMLGLPADLSVRFIFPHAPVRPITVNGGMAMRGWYDIRSISIDENEDTAGVRESATTLAGLIDDEVAKEILPAKIVLAGFSQGGAIALFQGLRHPERLAGILALSTYLPIPDILMSEASGHTAGLSVFMGHGTQDPIVPLQLGEQTREILVARGLEVEWKTYPMGHSITQDEVLDIGRWLRDVLSR